MTEEPRWDRVIDPKGVLCYIESQRAFFTTLALADQWGDDWDDAPYEHNAGEPYIPRCSWDSVNKVAVKDPHDWNQDGTPKWHVFSVFFETDVYEAPATGYGNSPWSVQAINNGNVAWLGQTHYTGKSCKPIYAGTTYEEFCRLIAESGGAVYEPRAMP